VVVLVVVVVQSSQVKEVVEAVGLTARLLVVDVVQSAQVPG